MGDLIYGVDPDKEITPAMVRDALVACFNEAHLAVIDESKEYHKFKSKEEFENFKKEYILSIIKNFFQKVNADFDNPTKESLLKVVNELRKFASNYKDKKSIEKHASEILSLIDKLN